MTKQELLDEIATWPDDELFFVVRGSHPAAPETVREYARRVLYFDRISSIRAPDNSTKEDVRRLVADRAKQARAEADAAFAMADRMEALAPEWIAATETAAGLRADTKNAELEAQARADAARRAEESARQAEIDREKAQKADEDAGGSVQS